MSQYRKSPPGASRPTTARRTSHIVVSDQTALGSDMRPSAVSFLIESEFVADRIREYRKRAHAWADFRTRLQHSTTCLLDPLQGLRDAVHHDIGSGPLVWSAIALLDPGAAHSTRVIEGQLAIPTSPDRPAENAAVEVGGRLGCLRRYFQVTDFAVGHENTA